MGWKTEDKVLAGVTHLGILAGWVGLLITLAIYLFRRDQSNFVKRSAMQAMGYQVCALIIMGIVGVVFGSSLLLGVFAAKLVTTSIVSLALIKIVLVVVYALGIWGAIRSFLGENFKYPLIGDFIEHL